ncbi:MULTISPECIES: LysR family transcriptional regulator [Amycolatopsis]|uniref:LysR family transcriptional regulator, hydrogen peroxide-inducible genes activator n=2 Tax=Amycolatopsis TaxID=1813 RepID=A0A1I3VKQ5_9PSEU|nr:LysR substrate-binding domain-containing protein [Amycolatopsis sacchari]SFJ95770.1 LysR family transcriptional regulator, hydrogen peroxide-inducible genes activator [Amycolatopsis sacchari]
MELHQLRYVAAVAEAGGFTRAAEVLYLAQPSLSVQIRKLEKELGVALFERLGRKVVLTTAGEVFLEHVRPALFHLERAREEAVAVRNLQRGRLAIGTLPSAGASVLPRVLAGYRAAHPDIELRLIEHNVSADFERMVQVGELDLALTRAPWSRPGITGRVLIREPMVAMLPPGHRLDGLAELDLADLAEADFVAMSTGSGLRELLEASCRRHGFTPRVTVETEQLSVLAGMVRNGVGVSVVPRLVAADYPVAVRLADPRDARELAVVWRAGGQLAPAARALLDLLLTATRELSDETTVDGEP